MNILTWIKYNIWPFNTIEALRIERDEYCKKNALLTRDIHILNDHVAKSVRVGVKVARKKEDSHHYVVYQTDSPPLFLETDKNVAKNTVVAQIKTQLLDPIPIQITQAFDLRFLNDMSEDSRLDFKKSMTDYVVREFSHYLTKVVAPRLFIKMGFMDEQN